MSPVWYSCAANYAIITDRPDEPPRTYRSVFVFQAGTSSDEATAKAFEIARSRERDYVGGPPGDTRRVVWRLTSLETLDVLGETVTDGREVYGEPGAVAEPVTWTVDTVFDPESVDIGMSGV
ncbi:MAG: hypothetical protein HOY78_36720 [Saccharothrix sp.]|nr:hypothetical protein [Saccharothrix sp.]